MTEYASGVVKMLMWQLAKLLYASFRRSFLTTPDQKLQFGINIQEIVASAVGLRAIALCKQPRWLCCPLVRPEGGCHHSLNLLIQE